MLPQPQRNVYKIAVCFLFFVFCFLFFVFCFLFFVFCFLFFVFCFLFFVFCFLFFVFYFLFFVFCFLLFVFCFLFFVFCFWFDTNAHIKCQLCWPDKKSEDDVEYGSVVDRRHEMTSHETWKCRWEIGRSIVHYAYRYTY